MSIDGVVDKTVALLLAEQGGLDKFDKGLCQIGAAR